MWQLKWKPKRSIQGLGSKIYVEVLVKPFKPTSRPPVLCICIRSLFKKCQKMQRGIFMMALVEIVLCHTASDIALTTVFSARLNIPGVSLSVGWSKRNAWNISTWAKSSSPNRKLILWPVRWYCTNMFFKMHSLIFCSLAHEIVYRSLTYTEGSWPRSDLSTGGTLVDWVFG